MVMAAWLNGEHGPPKFAAALQICRPSNYGTRKTDISSYTWKRRTHPTVCRRGLRYQPKWSSTSRIEGNSRATTVSLSFAMCAENSFRLSGKSMCHPSTSYRICLQGIYFEHTSWFARGCTHANRKPAWDSCMMGLHHILVTFFAMHRRTSNMKVRWAGEDMFHVLHVLLISISPISDLWIIICWAAKTVGLCIRH